MRYNPDTERGIRIEDIATSLPDQPRLYPEPEQVWANGRWIPNPRLQAATAEPVLTADETLEGEATLSLWSARYKLQQIRPGSVPAATIASLKRDVYDIARELQRLS